MLSKLFGKSSVGSAEVRSALWELRELHKLLEVECEWRDIARPKELPDISVSDPRGSLQQLIKLSRELQTGALGELREQIVWEANAKEEGFYAGKSVLTNPHKDSEYPVGRLQKIHEALEKTSAAIDKAVAKCDQSVKAQHKLSNALIQVKQGVMEFLAAVAGKLEKIGVIGPPPPRPGS